MAARFFLYFYLHGIIKPFTFAFSLGWVISLNPNSLTPNPSPKGEGNIGVKEVKELSHYQYTCRTIGFNFCPKDERSDNSFNFFNYKTVNGKR